MGWRHYRSSILDKPRICLPKCGRIEASVVAIEERLRDSIAGVMNGEIDFALTNDSDVEHILPKTLTAYWAAALGGAPQEEWLDRLGNKGLYNSASIISNRTLDKQTNKPTIILQVNGIICMI